MNFYIPTYKDCIDIVNSNPDMYFYERKHIIDNYDASIFGYRFAKYNNFILPIIDKPQVNALELKGITYVFNDDNTLFDHFLLLHKFWELDQYNHCKYDLFKDKKIKNITSKEDGFLISFCKLPNGRIVSFAKSGFGDEINNRSNDFLDNKKYYKFINNCLINDIQPIFEYIGIKMVVSYDKQDLVLLKLRCKKTGKYLNIKDFDTDGISIVEEHHKTLDELLRISKDIQNFEGWVVHFEDDSMLKVKTNWWKLNHESKIL